MIKGAPQPICAAESNCLVKRLEIPAGFEFYPRHRGRWQPRTSRRARERLPPGRNLPGAYQQVRSLPWNAAGEPTLLDQGPDRASEAASPIELFIPGRLEAAPTAVVAPAQPLRQYARRDLPHGLRCGNHPGKTGSHALELPDKPSRTIAEVIKEIWQSRDPEHSVRCVSGRLAESREPIRRGEGPPLNTVPSLGV
jgi:hypothetical protein